MSDFFVTMSDDAFWRFVMVSALVISIVAAGILIPQILLIAFRKKLFDELDERKIHHSTVPRLGGMAFEPVILFTIFILLVVDIHTGRLQLMEELGENILSLSICVCSLILLYLVGIADDLIGVRYSAKFVVQVGCGLLFLFGGLYISDLHGLFFFNSLPWFLFWPMTVLLVVFIINAMNLIDGIDGLASGLSGVALGYYGFVFFEIGEYTFSLVAFATLGTVIPFFYYNVFGEAEKQKKIFMGDTGSLTIGVEEGHWYKADAFTLTYIESFPSVDGDATAIDGVSVERTSSIASVRRGIYTLQGAKVDQITRPGIYIVDGKKCFVKP